MKKLILIFPILLFIACHTNNSIIPPPTGDCSTRSYNYTHQIGCDGQEYPDPNTSMYSLPFPEGTVFKTGLTNCSSSYHAPEYPDKYAYDFDMPNGTNFYATRGGVVAYVEEAQPSEGGGGGNYVVIDHLDNTFGMYLHAPKDGIAVAKGDTINQGDYLGVIGHSGLAGYPHLHFIVVVDSFAWPYNPTPITFNNAMPADVILKSYTVYKVCE